MKKICGIYKITNKLNGKIFIGASSNCFYSFSQHLIKNGYYIDREIQQVGVSSFTFEVIKECKKECLRYWREFYIWKYCSYNEEIGYNERLRRETLQYFQDKFKKGEKNGK